METMNKQTQTSGLQPLQSLEEQRPISSTSPLSEDGKEILRHWKQVIAVCKDRDDCFFGNHPSLYEMNKGCSGAGHAVVSTCLELINEATNHKTKLSDLQILMLSETIYDKYSYLKDTEVTLFFYDYFKFLTSDKFYGSVEMKTVMEMLVKWVREKRGMAITKHDLLIKEKKDAEDKLQLMPWEEYCKSVGVDSSENPLAKLVSNFVRREVPKDTPESITESAQALIENKWGYDHDAMMNARRSFVCRYGYTPED